MSTPFGKRGHYWKEWSEGKTWQRTEIPATQVPRISPDFLEEERAAMGSWWYEQEYMCMFKESTDSVFDEADIQRALSYDLVSPFGDENVYFDKTKVT